jgi:hypothetical protein
MGYIFEISPQQSGWRSRPTGQGEFAHVHGQLLGLSFRVFHLSGVKNQRRQAHSAESIRVVFLVSTHRLHRRGTSHHHPLPPPRHPAESAPDESTGKLSNTAAAATRTCPPTTNVPGHDAQACNKPKRRCVSNHSHHLHRRRGQKRSPRIYSVCHRIPPAGRLDRQPRTRASSACFSTNSSH